MANKVIHFRREFTVTSAQLLTGDDEDGFYVGETTSLRVDIVGSKGSVFIEGKVARSGDFRPIADITDSADIDLRNIEFIRVLANPDNGAVTVHLFGYDIPIDKEIQKIEQSERDFLATQDMRCLLTDMLKELKTMNVHLQCVTGEDLDECD